MSDVSTYDPNECPPAARLVFEVEVPLLWQPKGPAVPPLNSNDRLHWRTEAYRKKQVRATVAYRARNARIPAAKHITVGLHYLPGDHRRRDPSNLMATQKPALDGLVDAGIVPDDNPLYVTELMPVIHPGPGERRLWLEVVIDQ